MSINPFITADYTIEFARVLCQSSPKAAFSFLSGKGADQTGRSRIAFARYKGEAEKALLAAGFPRVYVFRPAYIYPVFRVLFPNQVIRADDLARAMVDVAVRVTEKCSAKSALHLTLNLCTFLVGAVS